MANLPNALEVSRKDWNVSELIRRMDRQQINFDVSIQRGYVWDNRKNSLLIHSILLDYPISIFYFNKVGKLYEGIEGKQRSNALYQFIKGNYRLHANIPNIISESGEELVVARRTFDQIDPELQNKLLSYGLIIYSFENMSLDNKVDFFTRINSGKPVSAAEIARIKVRSRDIFLSLTKHPAILAGITDKAKKRCLDEDIVEDLWVMIYADNKSLLNKHRAPLLENNIVTDDQKNEIIQGLDMVHSFLKTIEGNKKLFSKVKAKTHFVSLGYMGVFAVKNNIPEDIFTQKVTEFFTTEDRTATENKDYNQAVGAGIAKAEQVNTRIRVMEDMLLS